jgi:hypothetical protein
MSHACEVARRYLLPTPIVLAKFVLRLIQISADGLLCQSTSFRSARLVSVHVEWKLSQTLVRVGQRRIEPRHLVLEWQLVVLVHFNGRIEPVSGVRLEIVLLSASTRLKPRSLGRTPRKDAVSLLVNSFALFRSRLAKMIACRLTR